MTARIQPVIALRPRAVSILIGANDLGDQEWLDALFRYTDSLRATGIKVAVGTVLPQYLASNPAFNTEFSRRRVIANNKIRAAVGSRIDAVIDYAADPVIGQDAAAKDSSLFGDGTHPTELGHMKLLAVKTPVIDALLLN
jgi:lysophospholipase L1-like esterase